MDAKKENEKNNKVEEPAVDYQSIRPKFKGIDHETFDFDAEFAKGLTPEEFKAEMSKRIKAYPWKNKP
ncbi:hypothetical protein [Flavobacterium sp. DG2-3]|uniref:hypothetical protein n=1 Tax=Flavobacterium sp. DG2-3 TaxID=3068317 RepID=UPI00273DBC92|nr:hypothetical protein [Flavobacterium sp. DG2-3]MDP5201451.1 hypothetical protein [Flavobacterium sp. DG2-3]